MEDNPKTKNNIARTLERVLDDELNVMPRIKHRILNELVWSATEDSDDGKSRKYAGQCIWSVKALIKLGLNRMTNGNKKGQYKDLIHEHIVTKEEIITRIKSVPVDATEYLKILEKFAHAAVIDKEEEGDFKRVQCNRTTPPGYEDNIYIRYKLSGIALCSGITMEDIVSLNSKNVDDLIRRKTFPLN